MTAAASIPDKLIRQLVEVGQADLVVWLPTFNHAAVVEGVTRAVRASFLTHFPRQRTLLIHADGGSSDGTLEVAHACWSGACAGTPARSLRSTHRVSFRGRQVPGRGERMSVMLGAASLVGARAMVRLDPDLAPITPERVAALARPVGNEVDFVSPIYDRQVAEGLLVTQFMRPFVRSVYGWRLQEPLATEFACSGRFAAAYEDPLPGTANAGPHSAAIEAATVALAGPFRTSQVRLGRRAGSAGRPAEPLPDVFRQVVGAVFQAAETHAGHWLTLTGSRDVPVIESPADEIGGVGIDVAPERPPRADSFAEDVRHLDEVLRQILSPATLAAVQSSASGAASTYSGALWAATVADFFVAFHRRLMRRDHITQALMPLYLARAGAFLDAHGSDSRAAVDTALDGLCTEFELVKARIVERWSTAR